MENLTPKPRRKSSITKRSNARKIEIIHTKNFQAYCSLPRTKTKNKSDESSDTQMYDDKRDDKIKLKRVPKVDLFNNPEDVEDDYENQVNEKEAFQVKLNLHNNKLHDGDYKTKTRILQLDTLTPSKSRYRIDLIREKCTDEEDLFYQNKDMNAVINNAMIESKPLAIQAYPNYEEKSVYAKRSKLTVFLTSKQLSAPEPDPQLTSDEMLDKLIQGIMTEKQDVVSMLETIARENMEERDPTKDMDKIGRVASPCKIKRNSPVPTVWNADSRVDALALDQQKLKLQLDGLQKYLRSKDMNTPSL